MRVVGFLLHQLEDKWTERYTCLVNRLNNSVFGENVGFCTRVSGEAGLKDRNGMKNAQMSRVHGGKELDKWAVPAGEAENELLSETSGKWNNRRPVHARKSLQLISTEGGVFLLPRA